MQISDCFMSITMLRVSAVISASSNSFVMLWTIAYQALFPWDSSIKNTGVGCMPPPGVMGGNKMEKIELEKRNKIHYLWSL